MSVSQLIKIETSGVWTGGVQTEIKVRQFEPFIVDEPKSLGGKDEGPNPLEFVLAGLSSCASVMIALIAKEQKFSYEAVEFKNAGELDVRGLRGVEGVSPHFQSVNLDVFIKTEESDERLEQLKEAVEKRCPVINLLIDAGVNVTSNWIKQ
ncbi:OsmC family protein [Sporosarcina sp. HYO08]|uniref:OsmC family protein n=1 Tax=Sporosarcina sp. HYO08 TaxID=1759557 RepID=UPI0007925EA4|nr:OsmC family protein [Sporosarcina sp. HYO08]KXH84035.1 osmotically inducible protein C [Sporosarcina sp. HYO08]